MNTGIGDAMNLAWKLAAVLQGRAPTRSSTRYEPERIAFARRLVATTDRAFTFVTNDGALARWVRLRIVPRILSRILSVHRRAALHVPHSLADRDSITGQPAQRRPGGTRSRRRPAAMGPGGE